LVKKGNEVCHTHQGKHGAVVLKKHNGRRKKIQKLCAGEQSRKTTKRKRDWRGKGEGFRDPGRSTTSTKATYFAAFSKKRKKDMES